MEPTKCKLWGREKENGKFVWELIDGIFLSGDKKKVMITDIPEDFGAVPDEDILELYVNEDCSEEYRINAVLDKGELTTILEHME